jgi:hypothetical protein
MDRERQERDVQDVFEATQTGYEAAIENTFALQERTLRFARNLIETPAEALQAQAESNRATLEALVEQSKRQREAMESLLRESAKFYESLLRTPFSHPRQPSGFEEAAKAPEVSNQE